MSKTKAELVKLGVEKYGIKNAADLSYAQLTDNIRALNEQANGPTPKRKVAPKKRVVKAPVKPVAPKPRPNIVELRKGTLRYYYVILSPNGEVLSTSEKYFSKYNAERAAFAASKLRDYTFRRGRRA